MFEWLCKKIRLGSVQVLHHQVRAGGLNQNDDDDDDAFEDGEASHCGSEWGKIGKTPKN